MVDTETTGYFDDGETFQPPRLVQIAWGLYAPDGREVALHAELVQPEGFTIPRVVVDKVHGIDTAHARRYGRPLADVMAAYAAALGAGACADGPCPVQAVVGHSVCDFDRAILAPELGLCGFEEPDDVVYHDTLPMARALLRDHRGPFKLPALYEALFGAPLRRPGGLHNAVDDVRAAARLYFALRARMGSPVHGPGAGAPRC